MSDPFSAPTAGGVKVTSFAGSLLLVTPREYKENVPTSFGEKDAVAVDLVVLDGTESGEPEEFSDVLLFQGVLIAQTKSKVGKGMVLGRLGQRKPTKPGQSGAWALEDPSEEDKQAARDYLANLEDPFTSAS